MGNPSGTMTATGASKATASAATKPSTKRGDGHDGDDDGDSGGDEGWRVLLLRGLVTGDIELSARALDGHIDVLSLPFTKPMPVWKVQWESLHWYLLRDATPLFIAAVYSHAPLIHWLLERGADRASKCYLGRTPLEFVGECCENAPSGMATHDVAVARSDACRRLLTTLPSPPAPPLEGVQFSCHIATQVVVVKALPAAATATTPSTATKQTIYKCLVDVAWDAPLSNGALIENYEVRQRLVATDADADGPVSSWRVERAPHNRRATRQGIVLDGLQFSSTYEVMLRSWNAAGKGDWGRVYKVETLASPEQQKQQQQQQQQQ